MAKKAKKKAVPTESTPVEEATPVETKSEGTTKRLFSDLVKTDEPVEAPPVDTKEETKEETPEEPTETPPEEPIKNKVEYLSPEDFGDKLVKVKIGGEEKEITFNEAIKNYQTDKYLTQKGQKIAEDFKSLQAKRGEVDTPQQSDASTKEEPVDDEIFNEYVKPYITKQEQEIEALRTEIAGLKAVTGPIQYQNQLSDIGKTLQAQDKGYDDFNEYVPKIERAIMDMPVEEQVKSYTAEGFISLYKDMKIAELRKGKDTPPEPVPAEERPTPQVTSIEGGGGTPSGTDDSRATYDAAFKRAMDTRNWSEVLRLKGL